MRKRSTGQSDQTVIAFTPLGRDARVVVEANLESRRQGSMDAYASPA